MSRLLPAKMAGVALVALTTLGGCFGTPLDKGDGSGTGTGRPEPNSVDQGRTGGLGSPRGNVTVGPGGLGANDGSAPGVGSK